MNQPDTTEGRENFNKNFFDEWSEKYDDFRISRWFRYTQELALEQFEWRPGGKLLDVGCGTGYAVICAATMLPEGHACGIDISPMMVERATSKVPPELTGRVEIRHGGAEGIPYNDDDFDYVLCTNSFHHYHRPMQALSEMRRVLKPGGCLVIFENAPDLSLYTWLWDRWLRIFEKGHVKYYPSRELKKMVEAAGLQDIQPRVLRNEKLKYGKLFASIQVWAAREPAESIAGTSPGGSERW